MKDLIIHEAPKHPISESVRLLRTNLSFLCRNKKNKVLLMTSTAPGEGKSWTASNLAVAFAQANQKVLLIDADLRKGRLHKIFGKSNSMGFSDYLQSLEKAEGDLELEAELLTKVIKTTNIENLFLITSGPVPFNPSELLSINNLDNFLAIAKNSFDVIIFDAPPVSIVTDALIICKLVDYVTVVAAVGETKKDMIKNTKKSIENVGGKIAGVVLNKMPSERRKEYNKYYSKYSDEKQLEEMQIKKETSSKNQEKVLSTLKLVDQVKNDNKEYNKSQKGSNRVKEANIEKNNKKEVEEGTTKRKRQVSNAEEEVAPKKRIAKK